MSEPHNSEIRIGIIGSVDSGKSTVTGVLKKNCLDNGKGLARSYVMKHLHEKESGKTSTVSYNDIVIKNDDGFIKKFIFVDLAGHEGYIKTTLYGLSGLSLNYIILVIGANMGINKITKEHFLIARMLKIPIIIVITKVDICPENILNQTIKNIQQFITTKINKNKLLNIEIDNDEKLFIIKQFDNYKNNIVPSDDEYLKKVFYNPKTNSYFIYKSNTELYNIFKNENITEIKFEDNINKLKTIIISNKTGYNIDLLKQTIYNLEPKYDLSSIERSTDVNYLIEETYNIPGVGLVLYGYLKTGEINVNDKLHIGPFNGEFYDIIVKNIRNKYDTNISTLFYGTSGCLNIKVINKKLHLTRNNFRKGLRITSSKKSYYEFKADIYILHHPTTIKENYQPNIHCGTTTQVAKICDNVMLRSGYKANVKFRFLFRPECIEKDQYILFRENLTKGIGKITEIIG
tara:strand:+ start:2501 stop:3880 length:1380 start_codon:yes stop_codon:yes gene_type:complete